ncbi:hypothetical protein [Solirubrobacter soli]|uniref:hypothetical protein n=1 Tax=Solirubrobacter soli TaxID=363832 RepID=UPI0012FA34E3|nr:hypothetical protein [Solirubrobacter soli]
MKRGLVLACAALSLATAPAAHAKRFNGMAFAGPAISGDSVVWGTEYTDGSGAVKVDGRVATRFERAKGKKRSRSFTGVPGAVSASPTRIVYTRVDSRVTDSGSDYVSESSTFTPLVSAAGGPFTNPLGCTTGANITTAVDGDTVVLGVMGEQPCAGVYVDGRKIDTRGESRQVRVAGPYVAWLDAPGGGGDLITVADRATGAVLATYPSKRSSWEVFDIDEQGNIVAVGGDGLVAFSLAAPTPRVLAKRLWASSIATAAGRVLYVSEDANSGPDRLVLADLDGKILKRLDRYGSRRWPEGEVALTDRWAAWSVKRATYDDIRGPGNVFLKKL